MITVIAALAAVSAAGSHKQNASLSSASRTPASRASSGSGDCQSQDVAWAPAGEKHQEAFGTALKKVQDENDQVAGDMQQGNSLTADTNSLAGDLGSLLGAIYDIKSDPPPSCIPGFAHDYSSAMDAFSNYGVDLTLMLGALNEGNMTSAQADIALASAAQSDGLAAMQSALGDLNTYNASES